MARPVALDALPAPCQAVGAGEAGAESERARRRAEDARLVARARGGDEDAFRLLVERYQKKVFWIGYDVLLDAEEARDVVQETFIRVHAALGTFDPSRDFLNWIYRIARNLAIDSFRRRRRRAVPMEDVGLMSETDGDGPVGGEELRERVALVLADLPLEYRLALTLREYHGMSPREIASITDCTYPTARWRLHRARTLFRKAWESRFGTGSMEKRP